MRTLPFPLTIDARLTDTQWEWFLAPPQRTTVCGRRIALVSLLRRHGERLSESRRVDALRVLRDDVAAAEAARAQLRQTR